MSPVLPTKPATAPFDKEGDVVLRSSDGVDFHVHKLILSLASPFFRDMFSLQPPASEEGRPPVVDVTEDEATIDILLRYSYPIPYPELDNLDVAERVLEAALKYDLKRATHMCKTMISDLTESQPLRVYAICCRFEWEEEARYAAQAWKKKERGWDGQAFADTTAARSYISEMADIPAGAYVRLLQFVHGVDVAYFSRPEPLAVLPAAAAEPESSRRWDAERVSQTPPFNRPDADLVILSADGVAFPVHRLMLELQSSTTADSNMLGQGKAAGIHRFSMDFNGGRRHMLAPSAGCR